MTPASAGVPPAASAARGVRPSLRLVAAGLACLLISFVALELAHPYFFFQDDNRDHLLPFFLVAYRTLATGEIGQIDFHQALGMPLLANGLSSVLSPLPYVAIALGRTFFGHDSADIEILVFLYYLIAVPGCVYLGRRLELSGPAVLLGTVSWICNPFLVYLSVSWVTLCPLVAFLPWIMGLSLALRERVTIGRAAALVVAHLGLLFAGFVQWFVYAVLFELALHALLALRDVRRDRRFPRALAAIAVVLVVVFLLGLPLLMPMWSQTNNSVERSHQLPFATYLSQKLPVVAWVNGLFTPGIRWLNLLGLGDDEHDTFVNEASPPGLSHLGFLALLLVPLALRSPSRDAATRDVPWRLLGWLGLGALLWSFGWLARPLYFVPVLNRFRWAFKLLAPANFFFCWLGAAGFDRLRDVRAARWTPRLAALLLGVHFLNLLAVNATHTYRGFREHTDPLPLVEPWAATFGADRVATLGIPPRALEEASLRTVGRLGFDYASYFGIYSFGGYDPLMTKPNSAATLGMNYEAAWTGPAASVPIPIFRAWSCRWYALPRAVVGFFAKELAAQGLAIAEIRDDRVLYHDAAAEPLVTWSAAGEHGDLAPTYRGNSLYARGTLPRPAEVTLRILALPFYEATVDGRVVPWRHNARQQIVVDVPAGQHEVRLRYGDPYFAWGLRIAAGTLALLALLGLGWWVVRRRSAAGRAFAG